MRLRTLHLRRKRKLKNQLRKKISLSFKGIKLDFSSLPNAETKLTGLWIEGKAVPGKMVKGFEFSFNNPLPVEDEADEPIRRFVNPIPEASISFKLSNEEASNFFSLLGFRQWNEPNFNEDGTPDGTYTHTMICDTEEYKDLELGLVSPYGILETETLE